MLMFENKALKRMFGPKNEVTEAGKLHEQLCNLYSSPDIIRMIYWRKMKWAGHEARMREMRSAFKILVGKSEENRLLRKTNFRWEDNIKMDIKETWWDGVNWIHLAQERDQ
jgi:hypothetical protein